MADDSSLIEVEAEARPCPVCEDEGFEQTMVEPELDGDHRYWECPTCGYAWGWERLEEGTRVEGNCAIGVPEGVRRQASAGAEQFMRKNAPVPLGLTIKKRPGLE